MVFEVNHLTLFQKNAMNKNKFSVLNNVSDFRSSPIFIQYKLHVKKPFHSTTFKGKYLA